MLAITVIRCKRFNSIYGLIFTNDIVILPCCFIMIFFKFGLLFFSSLIITFEEEFKETEFKLARDIPTTPAGTKS